MTGFPEVQNLRMGWILHICRRCAGRMCGLSVQRMNQTVSRGDIVLS